MVEWLLLYRVGMKRAGPAPGKGIQGSAAVLSDPADAALAIGDRTSVRAKRASYVALFGLLPEISFVQFVVRCEDRSTSDCSRNSAGGDKSRRAGNKISPRYLCAGIILHELNIAEFH